MRTTVSRLLTGCYSRNSWHLRSATGKFTEPDSDQPYFFVQRA